MANRSACSVGRVLCAAIALPALIALGACRAGDPAIGSDGPPVVAGVSAQAAAFEEARFAYGGGDYARVLRIGSRLAAEGYGPAYNLLHLLYLHGRGVDRDLARSVAYLRKGVAAGDSLAQLNLAYNYRTGRGVSRDYGRALDLFRQSAAQGNPFAQLGLGLMYQRGQGVDRDEARARRLFRVAFREVKRGADAGIRQYQHRLAGLHRDGVGTRRDPERALELYRRAAEGGYVQSMMWLARAYARGRVVPRDLAESTRWLRRAATASGDRIQQYNLAMRYLAGRGVAKDPAAALTWLRRAADQKLGHAETRLAGLLLSGAAGTRDPEAAARVLKASAARGWRPAMTAYGYLHETGVGVARDYAAAAGWYRKAAAKGHAMAHERLGTLYQKGLGVARDPAAAIRHYDTALAGLKRGRARLRLLWKREILIGRLTPAEIARLKADGLLKDGEASPGAGTPGPAENETQAVMRRLQSQAPEKWLSLLDETIRVARDGNRPALTGSAHILRAIARYGRKDYKQALDDADRGIRLGARTAGAYTLRGLIHMRLRNLLDARSDFTSAIRLKPDDPLNYARRAGVLVQIGTRRALVDSYFDFRKAYELDPDNAILRPVYERLGFERYRI